MVICLERGADLHTAQRIPLPLSLASVKSRLVLRFWYRLTRVVPDKGPLYNGCVCVCVCVFVHLWPGGVMDSALQLDLRLKGRGFDPRPFRFRVTTLGKLFAHMCLCHQAV